ncbi:MAG: hypothetical protein JF592_10240 [Microbacterium sp.]|uniref:hypothetical protein n=1 Tax=Microbacterium sp. TaxID=51671 RepID=UPI001D705C15|nr:hypothetical protein [Microbacterium sp.]MBW8762950.1 hypothetical protein [Microbacterium sp.]
MVEDLKDAPMEWPQVLYLRLTAQYDRLGAGRGNTNRAEDVLGWEHQVYFFVGRPHPDYSASVTVYPQPEFGAADWAVTPFDTGGMLKGHIATHEELDETERASIIERWTRRDITYAAEKDEWIDSAFKSRGGYVRSETPTSHVVPEVDLEHNSDHSWTWEGRLPSVAYAIRCAGYSLLKEETSDHFACRIRRRTHGF